MNIQKKILSLTCALSMMLTLGATGLAETAPADESVQEEVVSVQGKIEGLDFYTSGDGTTENPYQIATVEQLSAVQNNLTACYKLTADIDLSAMENWSPIGAYVMKDGTEDADRGYAFTGVFDGDNHVISGVSVDTSDPANGLDSSEHYGIFGTGGVFNCVADGTVKNLTVTDADVKGFALVAGVVGYGDHATILNVHCIGIVDAPNRIEATAMMAGGVIGGCMESTINGCSVAFTDVIAGMGGNSGAMGGGLSHSDVINCSVESCTVTAADGGMWIGGLSGCMNYGDAAASDHSFANCTVSNTTIEVNGTGSYVGGLVGAGGHTMTDDDDARALIENCKVQNVRIAVSEYVTCVGGLIGGGLRDGNVLPNSFCIKNCTVDDTCRIVSTADPAANLIGTLIGEAYLDQIEKDGASVNIIAREFDLSGTGTSTGIVLDGAETIGGLTDK